MTLKNISWGAVAVGLSLLVAACSGGQKYSIHGTIADPSDDSLVFMLDLEGNPIDSAQIVDGAYSFTGTVDKERIVYLGNSEMVGFVILEQGDIDVVTHDKEVFASGTPLNDEYNAFVVSINELRDSTLRVFEEVAAIEDNDISDSLTMAAYMWYTASVDSIATAVYADNPANLVGVLMMSVKTSSVSSSAELEEMLQGADPYIVQSELMQLRLSALREMEENAAAWDDEDDGDGVISVGDAFIDFTGIDPATGDSIRLGDYVGRGKPVFVDFWASWCGPCRRETPFIRAAVEQFADRVVVLGVGVSDTPEAHAAAVTELGITWPQILDVNDAGSAAYGIQTIPFTVLFAADGTVRATNLRGEAITEAIGAMLNE